MKLTDIENVINNSAFVIIHQDDNWADEMDVEGWKVATKERALELVEEVKKVKFPDERYVGTNESIEYDSIDDYFRYWKVKGITETDYNAFQNLFGSTEIGHFWTPEYYDEDDDDDDEE